MKFSVDWWSQNIPVWEQFVLPILTDRKEIEVLEIGAFEGRSTVWICEHVANYKGSFVTVIDTFEGSPEHREMGVSTSGLRSIFDENISAYKSKISVFVGKSQDILKEEGFDTPWYDLVYIDGSHTAIDVYTDAVLSWKAVKHSGVVVFDDYLWRNGEVSDDTPKKGIDKFLKEYASQLRIIHSGYQMVIQKI